MKSIDRQEGKISLGYRKEKDNPWNKFEENFKVDDILDCKVVRILPFGLFLEIIPKVEGLVHITEVSNRKITKPSEIVSIYDIVKAKIISIDNVNHHISMSMKGLNDFDSENFGGYANTRKTYEVEEKITRTKLSVIL